MLRASTLATFAAVALTVTACAAPVSISAPPPPPPPPPGGTIFVEYEPTDQYRAAQEQLQQFGILEWMADSADSYLRLPQDIPVVARECGEDNAFYDPELQRIEICYELVESYTETFSSLDDSPEVVADNVEGAVSETFMHELGHALIDILDLPTTGGEENAADQLAWYWLITSDGTDDVISAAEAYRVLAEETAADELAFYDSHPLDVQRYGNIMCYVYGSDEQQYQYLVDEGHLPQDRAETCGDEYDQLVYAWDTLLEPHTQ